MQSGDKSRDADMESSSVSCKNYYKKWITSELGKIFKNVFCEDLRSLTEERLEPEDFWYKCTREL